MTTITVMKLDHRGLETWRYQGKLLRKEPHRLILEAFFDRDDMLVHGLLLSKGDRFIETYYNDRWYNIFEVRDKVDDHLKGWYCNISCPAEFNDNIVSYRDLTLDLIIFPNGQQIVLDEDEFDNLPLESWTHEAARHALEELISLFQSEHR